MDASSGSRPGRCWYCGEARLRVGDPPEHAIPAAIGGSLTTDKVDTECNARAGREIDQPFLQDWFLALERSHFKVVDRRRKKSGVPTIPMEASLADGTPVTIDTSGDAWEPSIVPRVNRTETEIQISAPTEAEFEAIKTKIEGRLKRDGKSFTSGELKRREENRVDVRAVFDMTIWLRMSAKIALAVLSRVLEEDWLDTPQAAQLRAWVWDKKPKTIDGQHPVAAYPEKPRGAEELLMRPPEHLLMLHPLGPDRVGLLIALFGDLVTRVRIDLHGQPPPHAAWRINPHGGAPVETTDQALFAEAALEIHAAAEASRKGEDQT